MHQCGFDRKILAQFLEYRFGRAHGDKLVVILYHRAYDIRLHSLFLYQPFDIAIHWYTLSMWNIMRCNGLSSGRHIIDYRHIQIAVKNKRQSSRYRGCAHYHYIRIGCLAAEPCALINAETMLFISDDQPKPIKLNSALNESMCSRDRSYSARTYAIQYLVSFFCCH